MITIDNYKDTVKDLDYSKLPATFWKTHQFIEKSTDHYSNWNSYNKSESIKRTIDSYFTKLDEFLKKHPIKPKYDINKNIHIVSIDKSYLPNTEPVKPKESHKVVKQAPPHYDDTEELDLSFVERIPEEIKLMRRYIGMDGKKKTKEDMLRFINVVQRAIVERKVRKASPYAKHIEYIQEKLIARYNDKKFFKDVSIDEKIVAQFKNLIAQEKVMPSVLIIKRYISLNGKFGMKQKAQNLLNAMERAFKLGRLTKKDKYNKLLDEIHANLTKYLKSKSQNILDIAPAELSGLNGVLGCHCGLSGIDDHEDEQPSCLERDTEPSHPVLPKGVMSSMDFSKMQFKTLGFIGKYRKLIGDPNKGFTAMVYGKPKMGKSFLCIDFAGYLARNHGKVLYIAREEGLDMTLQEKLKSKDVAHPNLFVSETIPDDLTPYEFMFFDSVNKLGLSTSDLESLKSHYPDKSFIYIFQTTKEGNFRGANEFQHDVDVVINLPEKGLAVQNGRFNQGGEMRIFEEGILQQAA